VQLKRSFRFEANKPCRSDIATGRVRTTSWLQAAVTLITAELRVAQDHGYGYRACGFGSVA
jgi:hypothetical protein